MTVNLVFLLLALICFIVAATGLVKQVNVGWLGMAFWMLSLVING